jgi:hypothetical protein
MNFSVEYNKSGEILDHIIRIHLWIILIVTILIIIPSYIILPLSIILAFPIAKIMRIIEEITREIECEIEIPEYYIINILENVEKIDV